MRRWVAAGPGPCMPNAATRISGARDQSARYTRKACGDRVPLRIGARPVECPPRVAKSPRRDGGVEIAEVTVEPSPNPHRTLTRILTAFSHPAPKLICRGIIHTRYEAEC